MKEFNYTVTSKTGLHMGHVGLLAQHAKAFQDTKITVSADGNMAKPNQLMRLLGMGLKRGSHVIVVADGPQEDFAIENMRNFFEYYL